jgi:hypothetical protein
MARFRQSKMNCLDKATINRGRQRLFDAQNPIAHAVRETGNTCLRNDLRVLCGPGLWARGLIAMKSGPGQAAALRELSHCLRTESAMPGA